MVRVNALRVITGVQEDLSFRYFPDEELIALAMCPHRLTVRSGEGAISLHPTNLCGDTPSPMPAGSIHVRRRYLQHYFDLIPEPTKVS